MKDQMTRNKTDVDTYLRRMTQQKAVIFTQKAPQKVESGSA